MISIGVIKATMATLGPSRVAVLLFSGFVQRRLCLSVHQNIIERCYERACSHRAFGGIASAVWPLGQGRTD
jgi:hypothetical protein